MPGRADAAVMRVTVTEQYVKNEPDKLTLFRMMRETLKRDLSELVPTARLHIIVSRVAPRCIDMTAIASLDDEYALRLANRMRWTRRHWKGYRTDLDWMEDNRD